MIIQEPLAVIAAATTLQSVPLVPEIRIRTTEDLVATWEATGGKPPPFWAFPWAGGQALARYLLDHGLAAARDVLDLGAGSGLVAMAAALAGARNVVAAEIDPLARAVIALNARDNGVAVELVDGDVMGRDPPMVDFVLAGDLFYERDLAERVLAWLCAARAAGTDVLVGDPGRTYFPEARFERLAEYDVPVSRQIEDGDIKRASVWRLIG